MLRSIQRAEVEGGGDGEFHFIEEVTEQVSLERTCRRAGGAVEHGRLLFRPISDVSQVIDVTERLISAVAHELWERFGETAELNWVEAELLVEGLLGQVEDLFIQRAIGQIGGYGSLPPSRPPRPLAWDGNYTQTGEDAA